MVSSIGPLGFHECANSRSAFLAMKRFISVSRLALSFLGEGERGESRPAAPHGPPGRCPGAPHQAAGGAPRGGSGAAPGGGSSPRKSGLSCCSARSNDNSAGPWWLSACRSSSRSIPAPTPPPRPEREPPLGQRRQGGTGRPQRPRREGGPR